MIKFTPKKFFDVLDFHDVKFQELRDVGVNRESFIPRTKKGSRRIKDLTYGYQKTISNKAINKIAESMIEIGLFPRGKKETIIECFEQDDFDVLLPEDLM